MSATATFCFPLHSLPYNPRVNKKPLVSSKTISISGGHRTRRREVSTTTRSMAIELSTAGEVGGDGEEGGSTPDALPSEIVSLLEEGSPSTTKLCGSTFRGSVESTLNGLSKWIVAALYGGVIIWKHDAEILWAAMGSVLNAWLSITLKRIINHQRPAANLKSGPGMPSSHAQSIFYASVFLVIFMVRWLGANVVSLTIGALVLGSSSYLSWLRVSQQFHTFSQVLVGAIIGSLFATSWFWSWHTFMLKAFIHSIWVRIIIVLSSVFFCVGFMFYVIRHWLKDDK